MLGGPRMLDHLHDDGVRHVLLQCDLTALRRVLAVSQRLAALTHDLIRSADWSRLNMAELQLALWDSKRMPTMRCYGLEEPDSNWRVSVHGDDVFTAGVNDVQIFRIADGTVVHTVPEGAAEVMSAVLHGDYVAMVLMESTSSTEVFEMVSGKKLKLCHSEKRGRVESLAWVCQEESADSMPMLLEYCRTHGNDSWDAAEAIGTDPEGALYLWRLGSNLSDAKCVCMCTLPTPPNPTDGEWVNAVMDVQGQNVLLMSCSGRCVYAFDISSLELRYTRTLESLRDSLVSTVRWNLGFMSPMSYYEGWTALPRNDGIIELWRSSTPGVGDDEHFYDLLPEEEHDYSKKLCDMHSVALAADIFACGMGGLGYVVISSRKPYRRIKYFDYEECGGTIGSADMFARSIAIHDTRIITTFSTSREDCLKYGPRVYLAICDIGLA